MNENSYEEHKQCLISGSTKLKPLKGYEKNYLVKSSPLGFVFCSRIPTKEELVKHYENYPRTDDLSAVTVKRYNELLDEFQQYHQTGRTLDVGCGVGYFLEEARKRGWQVYGTEFTDEAIKICEAKGIKMYKGGLDPSWFEPGFFDIVVCIEVIEHINNPKEEMRNINKILRTGGLFYFTTPNFNSIERLLLKAEYNVIQYPEHLSYYTKKTIHFLLKNSGFKKIKLLTTGLSLTRIKNSFSKNNAPNVSSTSTDEKIRTNLEKNSSFGFFKKIINQLLTTAGVGSSLKGWYIKKAEI